MNYSLEDIDGNAFAIMGYVKRSMRKEGYSEGSINDYVKKATSSDYDNLLTVSMQQIDQLNEGYEDEEEYQ